MPVILRLIPPSPASRSIEISSKPPTGTPVFPTRHAAEVWFGRALKLLELKN